MTISNNIVSLSQLLKSDQNFFLLMQGSIAREFKSECQRFRRITQRTELTVAELDTISENAARNYLKGLCAIEADVSYERINY